MLGVDPRHPDMERHERELHHQADQKQHYRAGDQAVARHSLQLRDLERLDAAVDHQRGGQKQQRAGDAPGKAHERHPHPLPVAEERHQKEQGDGQHFQEEVQRDEVGAEDRADEADREEQEQIEETRVVRGAGRLAGVAVQHFDAVLDVADGVDGQRRAQDADDDEHRQAEAVREQPEANARGNQQVLLGEDLPA